MSEQGEGSEGGTPGEAAAGRYERRASHNVSAARIVSLPLGFLSCLALLPTQFVLKLSADAMLPPSAAKSPVSIPALCSLQARVGGDRARGRSPSPNAPFLLQTQHLLLYLLWMDALSFPAERGGSSCPYSSPLLPPPLLSRDLAVGSWRGEQQQRGGWWPGGTGGLGARSVWPGCAAAAHPLTATAVQGVGKQMMLHWGAWGLWEAAA